MTALESSLEEKEELAGKLYLAAWVEEVSPDWREEGEVRRVVAGHKAREFVGEAGRKRSVRDSVALLVRSLYTPDQGEKRPKLSWAEPEPEQVEALKEKLREETETANRTIGDTGLLETLRESETNISLELELEETIRDDTNTSAGQTTLSPQVTLD